MDPSVDPHTSSGFRDALPVGFQLGDYSILDVLGQGGFGITYSARDTHLSNEVAIKEYLPRQLAVRHGDIVRSRTQEEADSYRHGLRKFGDEARTLARFNHPNIIRVIRYFEANQTGYMVMDRERGRDLSRHLRADGRPQDDADVWRVLLPLLDGLGEVHLAGFLHRDIKPANIFIRRDGSPVLLDFGAAREAVGRQSMSLTSIVSPGYSPWEQYGSGTDQGPWSDIYALGAVLYRMTTNRRPLDAVQRMGEDLLEPASRIAHRRFSPSLLAAIDWALELRAQDRPQSIADWLAALIADEPCQVPRLAANPMTDDEETRTTTVGLRPGHATADGPAVVAQAEASPPPVRPTAGAAAPQEVSVPLHIAARRRRVISETGRSAPAAGAPDHTPGYARPRHPLPDQPIAARRHGVPWKRLLKVAVGLAVLGAVWWVLRG